MDLYSRGFANIGQATARAEERIFALPGSVQNELLTVAHMVKLVSKEIAAHADKVPPELAREWAALREEWTAFAADKSRWVERVWQANLLKALEYRSRIEDFRGRLARALGRLPVQWPSEREGPRGATPMPGKTEPVKKAFPWRTVFYIGLGIGGAYAISELLNSGTEMRREFRQPMDANDVLAQAMARGML